MDQMGFFGGTGKQWGCQPRIRQQHTPASHASHGSPFSATRPLTKQRYVHIIPVTYGCNTINSHVLYDKYKVIT